MYGHIHLICYSVNNFIFFCMFESLSVCFFIIIYEKENGLNVCAMNRKCFLLKLAAASCGLPPSAKGFMEAPCGLGVV
uniref:Uncharacterized protein n=1 Tax=Anguilla anguilla TaxID=7936 RepID=A0A0E9VJA4_ANGAN